MRAARNGHVTEQRARRTGDRDVHEPRSWPWCPVKAEGAGPGKAAGSQGGRGSLAAGCRRMPPEEAVSAEGKGAVGGVGSSAGAPSSRSPSRGPWGEGPRGCRPQRAVGRHAVRSLMLCADSAPALDSETGRCRAPCTASLRHSPVTPFQGKSLSFI